MREGGSIANCANGGWEVGLINGIYERRSRVKQGGDNYQNDTNDQEESRVPGYHCGSALRTYPSVYTCA